MLEIVDAERSRQRLAAGIEGGRFNAKNGYWQILMDEASRSLMAFSTSDGGYFEFEVMPFGLKNTSATVQRNMTQQVLVGYPRESALVYLDDIIMYINWLEEHLLHLASLFEHP